MGYWDGKVGAAENLRLFDSAKGWIAHGDVVDGEGHTTAFGAQRNVELALSLALNSSNLLFLSGAGTSFCATNETPGALGAPGMGDLWDSVAAAVGKPLFDDVLKLIAKVSPKDRNIERLLSLSKIYVELFDTPESNKIAGFIAKAEDAITKRVDFVDGKTNLDAHGKLIRRIARRGIRKQRARIFTTNYDLAFEHAAQAQRFTVIDGFSHAMPQAYDRGHFSYDLVRRDGTKDAPDYVENVFHLYKLHGSIDWRRIGSDVVRSRDVTLGTPLLIFPRDSKYQQSFESPYLDMMAALQSALREPDTALVVSGFGFNDEHIAKPIMAAVEANMTLRVVVCDVAFLDDVELVGNEHTIGAAAPMRPGANEYFKRFKKLAEIGDQRINLLNGRFEDLVDATPDLVAETERERHAERLKVLRDPHPAGKP